MASLIILFTSRARREMREILGFIAQDNLDAASKLAERIIMRPERLLQPNQLEN